MPDRSFYTDCINVHLNLIELIMILGHQNIKHGLKVRVMLIMSPSVVIIAKNDVFCWLKIDAQLCIILKCIIR